MTRTAFLAAYRQEVIARYSWATDIAKVDRFMESARITVHSEGQPWNHRGPAVNAAWQSVGGTGTPTLKALRALA